MRVLVTGAAGFVGYAVAALLVDHGHEVMGLTRSRTGALPQGVQRLEGDLRTPETLPRAVAEVDAVCHLAGLTKVRQSRTGPVDYWRTNLGGTPAILDRLAGASAGAGQLVLASTCTVYGEQAEQPISETAAVAPTNPYATTKLAADQAAADLAATGAIGAISLGLATPKIDPPRNHLGRLDRPDQQPVAHRVVDSGIARNGLRVGYRDGSALLLFNPTAFSSSASSGSSQSYGRPPVPGGAGS